MRDEPKKEDLFKIPNILCYVRILLIPVFIITFLKHYYWQSALVVIVASATDILDGWIARHFNMITDWGKFIDPVADKLMQLAMLIMSFLKNPWVLILVGVFVLKEAISLIVGIYIYHKGDNLSGAMWCGKLSTVVLDVSLLLIIALPLRFIKNEFVFVLIAISAFFLVLSFVIYMREYANMYKDMRADGRIVRKKDFRQ